MGREASVSLKTLQKLLNWETTVAKARTKIQTLSLSLLLLAPYQTGRAPLTSAPDSHHCKWQVCGDKCNCLFIQSCATELNGVIPDVHQRWTEIRLWPFQMEITSLPHPTGSLSLSILKKNPVCLTSTVAMHLKEIREPVYVVQLVGWYYRLLCCASFFFSFWSCSSEEKMVFLPPHPCYRSHRD